MDNIRNIGRPLEFKQLSFPQVQKKEETVDNVFQAFDDFSRTFPDLAAAPVDTEAMEELGGILAETVSAFAPPVGPAKPFAPPEMSVPRSQELSQKLWADRSLIETTPASPAVKKRALKNLQLWLTMIRDVEAINPKLATYFLEKAVISTEQFQMKLDKLQAWATRGVMTMPDEATAGLNRFLEHELLETYSGVYNMGTVETGRLYRGGQLYPEAMKEVAAMGVRTIVNLRAEDPYEEKPTWGGREEGLEAQKLGIEYRSFRLHDSNDPPPSKEAIMEVVESIDRARQPVYVHCAAGIGRTGMVVAAWRMKHGATLEEALKEAQNYGFEPEDRKSQVKVLEEISREYSHCSGYISGQAI